MELTISRGSVVVVAESQVSCDFGGEVAILDLRSGVYYGLDAVGVRIWQLIQEPTTVHAVCDVLLTEYAVAPDRCEHELLSLLQTMADKGLVEIQLGHT
jgi:hypothetical protein